MRSLVEADWIRADRGFAEVRGGAVTSAVTTVQDAAGGCDGIKNGKWGFHTASGEQDPWWQVDLGQAYRLDRVIVYNRTDGGTAARTRQIVVLTAEEAGNDFESVYQHDGSIFGGVDGKPLTVALAEKGIRARFVRLMVPGKCSFALDEVEVYAVDDPGSNVALGRPADQKTVGPHSYPGTMGCESGGEGDFSIAHTQEVIARTRNLVKRLISLGCSPGNLGHPGRRGEELGDEIARVSAAESVSVELRRDLYMRARGILRETAFHNPLLDFDRILFVKRHAAKGVFHMCDQYYGFNGVPGGGLYVLEGPFGPEPRVRDVLEGAVVKEGWLAGRSLAGGVFLSPELSYDGRTILFAWCSGTGKDLEWTAESCYHIFKVNVDGTGLVQLTDGPWNDFDPCFLPNGRIVFVSERRGGYLRCGRHCPTYTMFSMAGDGGDITCLSFHETHEWHPSIDNDGMIVYTRWDYVDRDTNVAHHIWQCFPDGRDPRSFHGNYPLRRELRPWMEMSIRAIPGSHKYVATAAAHHGHAFGSLVLIDQRQPDDGAMSQLTRLTPDVPLPEAERHIRPIEACMVYATAWPLSEDDYVCAYDADAKNHGIYWIDRFGNRELLYRDPDIACQSPIPLRARPTPPVIPSRVAQAHPPAEGAVEPGRETIAVANVYDSDFDWPTGVKIAALRVIQLLPKTTPPPNEPRIGVANQTNARAVLGTVPVERDGSAYFLAPAGKALYFQALDAAGMAVQSMRSVTYLHPGEQLTCLGCHEPKNRARRPDAAMPLAMRREPSSIEPEVEGSNPFSYVRLVQPVLDRHCVACHQQREALDLSGEIEGPHGWTRSYANLAGEYGFYYNVSNGSINDGVRGGVRTTPGRFGAMGSKLAAYMDSSHYDVKLSHEDRRRLTLWLDCNSEFFGSYEDTVAQARGRVVRPMLD